MSATGKGVSLIFSNQLDGPAPLGGSAGATRSAMSPVFVGAGSTVTFSHYVGRKAWQVLLSSGSDGSSFGLVSDLATVTQTLGVRPAPDTITVTASVDVFVSPRWEENSKEVNAIPAGSASVEIVQAPPQVL